MKKAAVLVAPGFEEGETLTITDILRRAQTQCDLYGLTKEVTGGHDITLQCDYVLSQDVEDYDMVILPGGYEGARNLRDHEGVIALLQKMYANHKYICAMCAAPTVLEKAQLLEEKRYTAYRGYGDKIKQGEYQEEIVVVDGSIVTSRGPATAYAFAYQLVELLGEDAIAVKQRMLYDHAFLQEGR